MADQEAYLNKRYGEDRSDYNTPKWRESIKVYSTYTGDLIKQYYNQDLREIVAKLRRDYFIDKMKLKVVASCGYVEYIG